MSHDQERLERKLAELRSVLSALPNVDPQVRQRLEQTLEELYDAMGESEAHPGITQRLTESARNFEQTHPNLSGMIGSVIDALGRMGI